MSLPIPQALLSFLASFFTLPLWYMEFLIFLGIAAFVASLLYFRAKRPKDQGLKKYLSRLRWISRVNRVYRRSLVRCLRALDDWLDESLTALRPDASLTGIRRWLGGNP